MTKNLIKNKSFFNLLLATSEKQGLALLKSITSDQISLLSEIAKNILRLPLPQKAKRLVNKKRKLFQSLAKKDTSKSKKTAAIRRNAAYILMTLWSLREQFKDLQQLQYQQ